MRTRLIKTDGLVQQVLEDGFETDNAPLVLLIHGFPELGVSWRAQVQALGADLAYQQGAGLAVLAGRRAAQDARLDLPPLPTTTIGSGSSSAETCVVSCASTGVATSRAALASR